MELTADLCDEEENYLDENQQSPETGYTVKY